MCGPPGGHCEPMVGGLGCPEGGIGVCWPTHPPPSGFLLGLCSPMRATATTCAWPAPEVSGGRVPSHVPTSIPGHRLGSAQEAFGHRLSLGPSGDITVGGDRPSPLADGWGGGDSHQGAGRGKPGGTSGAATACPIAAVLSAVGFLVAGAGQIPPEVEAGPRGASRGFGFFSVAARCRVGAGGTQRVPTGSSALNLHPPPPLFISSQTPKALGDHGEVRRFWGGFGPPQILGDLGQWTLSAVS